MMTSDLSTGTVKAAWAARALAALVILVLLVDAGTCLFAPQLLAQSMEATGFPMELASAIGMILLVCVTLFAIPPTRVLGAILLTGFLGGAICTHFRLGEFASPPQIVSAVLGAAAWASIYLRPEGLRASASGALRAAAPF
jgi:DoxX-like family